MHRIDHSTRRIDANGPGKDGFFEGDATTQQARSKVTDDWLNDVQEELCNAVDGRSAALRKGSQSQLWDAIRAHSDKLAIGNAISQSTLSAVTTMKAMAEDGDGRFVAGSTAATVNNVYYSSNYGETWSAGTAATSDQREAACFSPDDAVFVVVGNNGKIETTPVSSFGTFTARTAGASYASRFKDVKAYGGTILACGYEGEIQRSTDGGATWARVRTSAGEELTGLVYHRSTGRWVVVGCTASNAAFVVETSDDDGLTWDAQTAPSAYSGRTVMELFRPTELHDGSILAVAVDGASTAYFGFYVSRDAGETWERTADIEHGFGSVFEHDIAVSPSGVVLLNCELVADGPNLGTIDVASITDWRHASGLRRHGVLLTERAFRTDYRWTWGNGNDLIVGVPSGF